MATTKKAYTKRWPRKNLGELINFLERIHPEGLKVQEIAEKTGMCCQYISHLFSIDNMRLSKAEDIARKYGYALELFFPKREYKFGIVPERRKMKDYPGSGNLAGLISYMEDSNMSIHQIGCMTRMNDEVFRRAFVNGDISLSKLYDILNVLNIEVVWRFTKIEDKPQNHENQC